MLVGCAEAGSTEDLEAQGRALSETFGGAILMKGGHLAGATCVDFLVSEGRVRRYVHPRVDTPNTHGTGCTLSSAVAAGLALGQPPVDAVERAERYLHGAIERAGELGVGRGHGPVHHFHAHWPRRA